MEKPGVYRLTTVEVEQMEKPKTYKLTFTSKFGQYTEEIDEEKLVGFDLNAIPYSQFLRLNKTQQKYVLNNCAIRFWEYLLDIKYNLET